MVSFWARQILSKTHKNTFPPSLKEALRLTFANGNQSLSALNLRKSFVTLLSSSETFSCTRGFHSTVLRHTKSLKCPPPRGKKVWPCGIEVKKVIIPPSKCRPNYYDSGVVPLTCEEPGQFVTNNPSYKPQKKPVKNPYCEKAKSPCCTPPKRHSCIGVPETTCGCHKPRAPTGSYSELLALEIPSMVRCRECGPHYSVSCKKDRSVKWDCHNRPMRQRRCKNYLKPVIKEPKWSEMPKCKKQLICDDKLRRPKRADEYMPKRPIKCLQPVFPHLRKITA